LTAMAMVRPAMAARRWIGAGGVSAAGFAAARALSTHVSVIGTSLCGFKAAFQTKTRTDGRVAACARAALEDGRDAAAAGVYQVRQARARYVAVYERVLRDLGLTGSV
jgi:hypothetical protein